MTTTPRRLFHNASVMTPSGRFAPGALLVAGERIDAVVARGEESALLGREDVHATDLGGGFVIPGFADAHFHLLALAKKSLRCDLGGARSPGDVVEEMSRYASAHHGEAPVVGVEWDESDWALSRPPTRAELDSVSTTRAVYARRICGHVGVVNSVLLRELEVLPRFVDTDNGLVTETAVEQANRLSAPPGSAVEASVEGAIRALHALGITAIHDIVTTGTVDSYVSGVLGSQAPLRIDALLVGSTGELQALRECTAHVDENRFRAAGIKRFTDGSIGGRTAALHDPYADADTRGELLLDREQLEQTLRQCADLGVVCAVHAIGDRAIRSALDAMAVVGAGGRAFRIEHAEVLGAGEVDAISQSGVPLVMQPNFVRNWAGEGGLYDRRLGRERWRRCNPFRTLETRGVEFVFSSDGMPPGPLFGLRGATHHPVPGESIGVVSALRRYTELPHRLAGHQRNAGRLEAGLLADFAVLSGNPFLADTDSLAVEATCVGGERVYHRDGPGNLRVLPGPLDDRRGRPGTAPSDDVTVRSPRLPA